MHSAIRTQEVNPARMTGLFKKQFELCRVGPGQTVAVVSDLGTRREYIQAAFAAAEEMGFDIYEMCVNAIPGWTSVGVPTIGKCKGTLEALMRRRHDPDLPRAAVLQVAARGAGQGRARADDHRRARRSLPAPVAARPEGSGAACAVALPADEGSARHQPRRHRPHLPLRRIPGDEPVRHGRRAGPLRPLGRRPAAHLPERGQLARQGRVRARRHRHPALLPLRRQIRSGSRSAKATSSASKAASTPR